MKNIIYLTLALCLFIACGKNEVPTIQCEDLKQGIINNTVDLVGGAIDGLCVDLKPCITSDDVYGQEENLNTLVQRLEDECDVTTSIFCYACMRSNPPLSIINVSFVENGVTYSKDISITTPDNDILSFKGN